MTLLQVGQTVSWAKRKIFRRGTEITKMVGVIEKVTDTHAIIRPIGNRKQRMTVLLDRLTLCSKPVS